MTKEEKAKAYDNVVNKLRRFMEHGIDPLITRADVQDFFPELAESEDEKIEKEIIAFLKENLETGRADETWSLTGLERWIAWLEKQATKSVNIDIESMVSQYKQRLKSQGGVLEKQVEKKPASSEKTCKDDTTSSDKAIEDLEKQVEKKPASSEKTCKDDTTSSDKAIEDLEKAIWYIKDKIKTMKNETDN